jgi:hypothetical protein
VPGGKAELFQWLCALLMNPPQPVVAGGPFGTAAWGWLAAVLPLIKNPILERRGRGGRAAGRVEELFQQPDALGMNPPQPAMASGLVGTAVLGLLAALLPLLKDLFPDPSAGEDMGVARSRHSSVRGTHQLCELQARPGVAVGGVGAAGRGYLAAVLPLEVGRSCYSALRCDAR